MKSRLDETNHMRRLMGLSLINEDTESKSPNEFFNDEFDEIYIHGEKTINSEGKPVRRGFCNMIMNLENSGGWRDLSEILRVFNTNQLKKIKERNILNLSTADDFNRFIDLLPHRIYSKCHYLRDASNMTRGAVENTNKKILNILLPNLFKSKNNTDVVANFDKEKVTDDLANKTTIKDGMVHVPFAIDDFPAEDWDLYFESFDVSNDKFGFTEYLQKEYNAGDVDAEDIWNEYQEAVLHRLMNNS